MKKMKLTKRWKNRIHSSSSDAWCGNIHLQCLPLLGVKNIWFGRASISVISERIGPNRKSIKEAQQDAKELVVEVLRDIRDGTKELMDYHGMGEED